MVSDGGDAGIYQEAARGRGAEGRRSHSGWLAAAVLCWAGPAIADLPPSGLTSGRMCVSPLDQRRGGGDCGAVDILLLDSRRANVRVSDIVYRLELDRGQIDVILMHGTMQIDGFTTRYAWQGKTLNFSDPAKGMQYQIHFDPSKATRPR